MHTVHADTSLHPSRPNFLLVYFSTMRRALTVFLLLILPLQLSWAVAAAYCQHEGTTQITGHVGHHEHQHAQVEGDATDNVAKQSSPEQNDSKDKPQCVDDDCAYCHLASLKTVTVPAIVLAVVSGTTFILQAASPVESQTGGFIDRPNWRAA